MHKGAGRGQEWPRLMGWDGCGAELESMCGRKGRIRTEEACGAAVIWQPRDLGAVSRSRGDLGAGRAGSRSTRDGQTAPMARCMVARRQASGAGTVCAAPLFWHLPSNRLVAPVPSITGRCMCASLNSHMFGLLRHWSSRVERVVITYFTLHCCESEFCS